MLSANCITTIGGPYNRAQIEGNTLLWKTYGPRNARQYKRWYGNVKITLDISLGINPGICSIPWKIPRLIPRLVRSVISRLKHCKLFWAKCFMQQQRSSCMKHSAQNRVLRQLYSCKIMLRDKQYIAKANNIPVPFTLLQCTTSTFCRLLKDLFS